ncbi:APC family permease [Spiroplasma chrysopicola]|uniref:Putative permease n=1 Tax=Spiroplasma chrysopicola DF-1 TaxID=1276227 RepID=R4UI54_9MOLU|nr:APC family permease [Spiroplasma chrysopicola]AGM24996.1 putative permease [Spiroplasma chrysopicola DF-1]
MREKKQTKKFSLADFVWLGFNYTVSVGFIGNFAVLSNVTSDSDPIGMHVVWVFAVEGLVAGICAWAFAKMAKIHQSNNNGAAYIYVRTSFGKFWGIFVAFMQYVSLPFLITIQVMMLIRGAFGVDFVAQEVSKGHYVLPWYAANWGAFGDLWLDLIGILIYMSASAIIFGGMKLYRKLANGTGIVKWATAGFLIIAGLALAFQKGPENLSYWGENSHFSLPGFVKAFNSCFFFFAGFETFSTAGKNIINPEKNIGRGITLIMFISTIFYIVISIIFFAAFNSFVQNMNMGTWNSFNNKVILYGGPIIMIISSFALKVNVAMQNALYGGTSIQPMATEGYLPDRFRKLNKDGLPVRASILNLCITVLMIFVWLAIPDLIKGISLSLKHGMFPTINDILAYKQPFNISSLTEAASAIVIFIYAMVIAVTLKLGFQKKIKIKIWEWIVFPVVLLVLGFVFGWHYYSLVNGVITSSQDDFQSKLTGAIIELVFIISSVSFATIWYFTYYRRKYLQRMQTNPALQAKLDSEFVISDDLKYVTKDLRNEVIEYLKRNKALSNGQEPPNENYQTAKALLDNINGIYENLEKKEQENGENDD